MLLDVSPNPGDTTGVILTYDVAVDAGGVDPSLFLVNALPGTFIANGAMSTQLNVFGGGAWPDPSSGFPYTQLADFLPGVPLVNGFVT